MICCVPSRYLAVAFVRIIDSLYICLLLWMYISYTKHLLCTVYAQYMVWQHIGLLTLRFVYCVSEAQAHNLFVMMFLVCKQAHSLFVCQLLSPLSTLVYDVNY